MSQMHFYCYKCGIEMICEGISIDPIDGMICVVYYCPSCKFRMYMMTYDESVPTQEECK